MIHKIPSSVDYNYLLKRSDTQHNESINQNSLKVPKVGKATNKKTLSKIFRTIVINSPLPPSFLFYVSQIICRQRCRKGNLKIQNICLGIDESL